MSVAGQSTVRSGLIRLGEDTYLTDGTVTRHHALHSRVSTSVGTHSQYAADPP